MTAFNVIDPNYYDPTPLNESIRKLSNKKNPITDELMASLVAKYMVGYIDPSTHNKPVQLETINQIFEYGHLNSESKENTHIITDSFSQLKTILNTCIYQIGMISDIAATTSIFKDIISRTYHGSDKNQYYGLDLGTGSGILTIPMLIQAYRNDFKHIKIYGIENDQNTIPYAKAILSKLSPNIIIEYGDITSPYTYRNLGIDNISFITNETIPREGCDMGIATDPFYPSVKAFSSVYKDITDIQSFPQALEVFYKGKSYIGTIANRFLIHDAIASKPSDLSAGQVMIHDKMMSLSDVGNEYIKSGLISRDKNRENRR